MKSDTVRRSVDFSLNGAKFGSMCRMSSRVDYFHVSMENCPDLPFRCQTATTRPNSVLQEDKAGPLGFIHRVEVMHRVG